MTQSTKNVQQVFEVQGDEVHEDLPVKAAAVLYEGDAVGDSSGYMRQLTTADKFAGFALRKADNSAVGALDGDQSVRVRQRGHILLAVAAGGVLANSVADRNATVYATDGATFTGSNGGGAIAVGKIERYVSSGMYLVDFEADSARSI